MEVVNEQKDLINFFKQRVILYMVTRILLTTPKDPKNTSQLLMTGISVENLTHMHHYY